MFVHHTLRLLHRAIALSERLRRRTEGRGHSGEFGRFKTRGYPDFFSRRSRLNHEGAPMFREIECEGNSRVFPTWFPLRNVGKAGGRVEKPRAVCYKSIAERATKFSWLSNFRNQNLLRMVWLKIINFPRGHDARNGKEKLLLIELQSSDLSFPTTTKPSPKVLMNHRVPSTQRAEARESPLQRETEREGKGGKDGKSALTLLRWQLYLP